MRLFVGIPVEGHLQEELSNFLSSCRKRWPEVKWATTENLHVTLRFLGEVKNDQVEEVMEWFQTVKEGIVLEELIPGEVGTFVNRDQTVIWLGLKDPEWLVDAAGRLGGVVAGIQPERREFRPHLTLGRLFNGRSRDFHAGDLAKELGDELPSLVQDECRVVLYKSVLKLEGPEYQVVC